MSSSVFAQCDGIIARLPTTCFDDATLFRISFDNEQIYLPVTGFALEMGGNYQFLHTVSDFVYFYSFGDRISELNVTGMAFIRRACNTGVGFDVPIINGINLTNPNDPRWITTSNNFFGLGQEKNNICDLYDYYMRNRASAKPKAIRVTFGNCASFWGFLTGMRIEIARPDVPVAQWVLRLNVLPR